LNLTLILQKEEHAPGRVGAPLLGKGHVAGSSVPAAVRMAIWPPSRNDQTTTRVATSHCREPGNAPAIGQSAPAAPTRSTDKVQIVSTQPELPVRCCTTQATAIKAESDSAMAAMAPR
jgi:hypothetical protein